MMAKDFKIVSFNANGLHDPKKRRDVFDVFRNELDCSIICVQETHWPLSSENFIRAAWGYNLCLAGTQTNKCGVAVLFRNNFEYKLHNVTRDPAGCYIVLDIELLKKRMTLVNVYGPSSGDDPKFFDTVNDKILEIGNECVIVVGDWNCPLNMSLDVKNYARAVTRPRIRQRIEKLIVDLELVDIFRELYPDKMAFTWRKFNSNKQGRLDYFLVSEDLSVKINGCFIKSGYRSDHCFVTLALKREEFKRDRPFWKFNSQLLRDRIWIDGIKRLILDLTERYAVPVYNFENICNVPREEIEFVISDQLFFEVLLMEIRGFSVYHSSYKKALEREREKNLLQEISLLEKSVNDSYQVENLEEMKRELCEIREGRIQGMAVRSRIKWIQEGEKVSRYFCNLEKRNFVNKAMSSLEKDDGSLISDQSDILKEVQSFYENLYSWREVTNVDLEELIPDAPVLSDEERNELEGPLTYQEALQVLKNMRNFRSPGADGFTAEFYKFFFKDIGIFLVRSLNEGYFKKQLSRTQVQGIITCIPKEGKPKHFLRSWRPISLLNVSYKIGSACIARRLQHVLPSIIHDSQKGFIKGRYIGDNIRLLYDVMLFAEKENVPGLLLMVDFEKAFDSVSWDFLEKCLKFFKFPKSIVDWFHTLYNGASSCVYVNGQYSEWFSLNRGCRQGDPISPYFYLICAEVLSLLLRKNDNIKGIPVKNKEYLLSLFADDTSAFLDGSERSFTEAIHTFDRFSEMSGLRVNNEKTKVVWIGSRRGCGVKYMRDRNFLWDPGIFKVLGITFSTDTGQISRLNYEGKLLELKKLINVWSKRQLTPIGKITVIKTLLLSKLTYFFINVPDPPPDFLAELEKMFFRFLWDGKPSKIKKSVVCKDYEEGGLKMCDIYSFLATMKLSWLRRLEYESSVSDLVLHIFPELEKLKMFGSQYVDAVKSKIKNPFWIDVLLQYKKFCHKCIPKNTTDFLGEFIFYNDNILRDKKVLYNKEWVDSGILQIKDVVNDDGRFFTFQEFRVRYPRIVRTNFLWYEGVIQAIRMFQGKYDIILTACNTVLDGKTWTCIRKGNDCVKSILLTSDIVPTSLTYWNAEYLNLKWKVIFRMCFKISMDTQLRWFQAKILHRILCTKKLLYKCKLAPSPMCTFCKQHVETIEHLLWDCPIVEIFWNDLLEIIRSKCLHCERFSFTKELVIFNYMEGVRTDKPMDLIVLLAKFFIYKCQKQDSVPRAENFIHALKDRYNIELYSASILGKRSEFLMMWFPYEPLVSDP